MEEPSIQHQGERFKPDLVVWNEERALIVDVTVRYENKEYLALAAAEKIQKYEHIANKMKEDLKVRKSEVIPIVIGSRGALPPETTKILGQLKIGKADWLTLSMIALRSSIEIANAFMDN